MPPLVNLTGETPRCGRRDARGGRSPQELKRPSLRAPTRPSPIYSLKPDAAISLYGNAYLLLECPVCWGCRGSKIGTLIF